MIVNHFAIDELFKHQELHLVQLFKFEFSIHHTLYIYLYDRYQPTSSITKLPPFGCSNILDQSGCLTSMYDKISSKNSNLD